MVKTVKEMMNPKVKSLFIEKVSKINQKIFNRDKVIKVLSDTLSEVFPDVEFHNTDSKAVTGNKDPKYIESWENIKKYSGLKRIDFFLPSSLDKVIVKRQETVQEKQKGSEKMKTVVVNKTYHIENKFSGYEYPTLSSLCFYSKPTGKELAGFIEKDL